MYPDFVRDGVNGLLLGGRPPVDGGGIMAPFDAEGRGMSALNEGAFAAAPTIPSWEEVMAEWHQLYRKAALAAA